MPEIRRRAVISLGAQGFLALTAMLPFLGCAARTAPAVATLLDWQHFIDQLAVLAKVQYDPAWDQVGYLERVRAWLVQLDLDDAHVRAACARYRNVHRDFPEINQLHHQQEFQVSLLEFEPGERIALHDHPDMTGCIRCVSGRIQVRNFSEMGHGITAKQVRLRHEATVTMSAGSTGMLSSTTGNIHDLHALEFTRLIDIFTPPYNDDRSRRSRWFTLGEAAGEGEYTAVVSS